MGLSCSVPSCAKSYIFSEPYYKGNRIFKKLKTDFEINTQNLKNEDISIILNFQKKLQEIDDTREIIANKFTNFLQDTGACVLLQPTLERGLITYVIYFISQILICAKEKNEQFNIEDFSLSKFISFSKDIPFININPDTLNNLKNKYNFDFNMNDNLIKGKDSILEFLSTITKTKTIIENQIDVIKTLSKEMIINKYILEQIRNLFDSLKFIWNYFSELFDGIIDVQKQLTNNKRLKLFYNIANKAAEKKIKDPKYLALLYSNGDNCGDVNNWEQNITYKETDPTKY